MNHTPNAGQAGTITLGGDLTVNRLGFGAMRLTGPGIWGEPKDPQGARRVLQRVPAAVRTALGLAVVAGRSEVGGGALPLAELPTAALALGTSGHPAAALDARLRVGRPPVIGRIAADRLLLDCRTVMDDEVPLLAAALTALV